jgi:hypothetical protein
MHGTDHIRVEGTNDMTRLYGIVGIGDQSAEQNLIPGAAIAVPISGRTVPGGWRDNLIVRYFPVHVFTPHKIKEKYRLSNVACIFVDAKPQPLKVPNSILRLCYLIFKVKPTDWTSSFVVGKKLKEKRGLVTNTIMLPLLSIMLSFQAGMANMAFQASLTVCRWYRLLQANRTRAY